MQEGRSNPDPAHTTLLMTYGQFLDHDMGLAPHSDRLRVFNGNGTYNLLKDSCNVMEMQWNLTTETNQETR